MSKGKRIVLNNTKVKKILELEEDWRLFKHRRNLGSFNSGNNKDFITVVQREKILESLFDLILHS